MAFRTAFTATDKASNEWLAFMIPIEMMFSRIRRRKQIWWCNFYPIGIQNLSHISLFLFLHAVEQHRRFPWTMLIRALILRTCNHLWVAKAFCIHTPNLLAQSMPVSQHFDRTRAILPHPSNRRHISSNKSASAIF